VTYKSDGWRIIQKSKKKNAKSQFKIAADWASDSFGAPSRGVDVGFPLPLRERDQGRGKFGQPHFGPSLSAEARAVPTLERL
jgi:hypothetical protein